VCLKSTREDRHGLQRRDHAAQSDAGLPPPCRPGARQQRPLLLTNRQYALSPDTDPVFLRDHAR
jgi:hypothetical protein